MIKIGSLIMNGYCIRVLVWFTTLLLEKSVRAEGSEKMLGKNIG